MEIDAITHRQIIKAIRLMRSRIQWKLGKDIRHLQTRIDYGHLEPSTLLVQYEVIIQTILLDSSAQVYVYGWKDVLYPTVVSSYDSRKWLVMFSLGGIMETAFPPTDPNEYLSDIRFYYLGNMENVLNE